MPINPARLFALALLLAALSHTARAEFPEGVPDRFRLRAGVFFADLETEVSSGEIDSGLTELIDLERDLELPSSDEAFRIDGSLRLSRRAAFDFGYVEFSRSQEGRIARAITFEEFTFLAVGTVRGAFESVNSYLALRYDVVRSRSFLLGASLGVDWFDLKAEVSGEGVVIGPNGIPILGGVTRDASVSVPAPVLGLEVAVVVVPRAVTLGGYLRAISLEVDEAEGHLLDASARAQWFALRNLGVGVSYDWSELELDRLESDDFEYSFRYRYAGPRAFLILTF